MRYFLLVQGGCETINEQPYRSVNFATIDKIGMSDITAKNTGNICGTECNSMTMEMDRPSTCHDCSKEIAKVVLKGPMDLKYFLVRFRSDASFQRKHTSYK